MLSLCCSSAVAACDAADRVLGRPTGWTAACQWSCNSAPYQRRAGFSASLLLHRSYCFTQYSRSSGPLMFLRSVIQCQMYTHLCVYCGSAPFAQLPNQCLITFSNRADTQGHCNVMSLDLFLDALNVPSVSPQLFREVRIMKILNHPNIGEFKLQLHGSLAMIFPFNLD